MLAALTEHSSADVLKDVDLKTAVDVVGPLFGTLCAGAAVRGGVQLPDRAQVASWAVHAAFDALQPASPKPAPTVDIQQPAVVLQRAVALSVRTETLGVWVQRDLRRWWLGQPVRDVDGRFLDVLLPAWVGLSMVAYVRDVSGNVGSVMSCGGLKSNRRRPMCGVSFVRRLCLAPAGPGVKREVPAIGTPLAGQTAPA